MDSGCDYDCSPNGYLFRSGAEVSDDSHLHVVASYSLGHDRLSDSVLTLRLAEPLEMLCAVTVGIRVAMSYIHFIIVMHELDSEGKGEVRATSLFLQ